MNPPLPDEGPFPEEPQPWEDGQAPTEPPLEADPVVVARRVEEVRTQLGEHAGVIEEIIETLERLTESPPKSTPSPFSWTHADAQQRRQLWRALGQWVQWHNADYAATSLRIPPCWYRHATAVVELTALMEAWRVAYIGHQAPTLDAAQYLQHYLHPMMDRIHQANWGFKNCSGTRHELKVSESAAAPFSLDDPEFEDLVEADVGAYRKQEPPVDPTETPEPDSSAAVTRGGDAAS